MIQTPEHPQLANPPLKNVSLLLIPTERWNFEDLSNAASSKYAPLFPKIEHRRVRRIYEVPSDQSEESEAEDFSIPDDQPHMRLLSEDELTYISIGPRFLGFEQNIYDGWSSLKLLLLGILDVAFSGRDALEFEFVSLKYENEIEIKDDIENIISSWLLPNPYPDQDSSETIGYRGTRMIEFHDGAQRISIDYPLLRQDSDVLVINLSIDHSRIFPSEVMNRDDLSEWLDIAHERIYASFCHSFTQKSILEMK